MGSILQPILGVASGIADFIPGAQPIGIGLGLADSAIGAGNALASQNAQNQASQNAQQNQNNALGQTQSLAQNLAQGPSLQSLIDAEGSGIKTLQSNIGGVANPAALIKELMGQNVQNAISAGINNRSSNLQGAINALLGVGQQFGNMGERAAGAATAGGNPFNTFANSLTSAANQYNQYQQWQQAQQAGSQTGVMSGAGSGAGYSGYNDTPVLAPNNWAPGTGGGGSQVSPTGTEPGAPYVDPNNPAPTYV